MSFRPCVHRYVKIRIKASSPAYGEALTYSLSLYTSSHLHDPSSAMAPANPACSLLHEMLAACEHSPYFVFQLPIILGKSCQYFFIICVTGRYWIFRLAELKIHSLNQTGKE